jgi:hypothetical protein
MEANDIIANIVRLVGGTPTVGLMLSSRIFESCLDSSRDVAPTETGTTSISRRHESGFIPNLHASSPRWDVHIESNNFW